MKKILSWLILLILLATPSYATVYYGGAAGKNINADDLWYEGVTGSCAGDGSPVAWSEVVLNTPTLIANGCTIAIPNDANVTITAAKISNKETDTPDADCVDGGQFTYVTSASYTATINADLEAGATADLLAISGSAAGAARVTIVGDLTGGSGGTGINAVIDSKTGATASVVVQGNITGGTGTSSHAYYLSGSTGLFTHSGGNITGVTGLGLLIGSFTSGSTITGDVIGSDTSVSGMAVSGLGTGTITIVGNIKNGAYATALTGGRFIWNPTAPSDGETGHYTKYDGGGTPVYVGKVGDETAANVAAKVATGEYFIKYDDGVITQGTAEAGASGGAWGF